MVVVGQFEREAFDFMHAVKLLATHPDRLDNFESYLGTHFDEWLSKHANTPEKMASEMMMFAKMEN